MLYIWLHVLRCMRNCWYIELTCVWTDAGVKKWFAFQEMVWSERGDIQSACIEVYCFSRKAGLSFVEPIVPGCCVVFCSPLKYGISHAKSSGNPLTHCTYTGSQDVQNVTAILGNSVYLFSVVLHLYINSVNVIRVHLKLSSVKCRPFCLGTNVLIMYSVDFLPVSCCRNNEVSGKKTSLKRLDNSMISSNSLGSSLFGGYFINAPMMNSFQSNEKDCPKHIKQMLGDIVKTCASMCVMTMGFQSFKPHVKVTNHSHM